ncbi:MAG TPA: hypothetical protein VFD84_09675 [Candidatus Binatia bacterium]|nr:hypothetical protein [Candidatus Binatia bacterium]
MRPAAALLLTLAACHGDPPHPYPTDVQQNFLRTCTARADDRTCRCALDALERRFTIDEFRAFETRLKAGDVPSEMVDATAKCR